MTWLYPWYYRAGRVQIYSTSVKYSNLIWLIMYVFDKKVSTLIFDQFISTYKSMTIPVGLTDVLLFQLSLWVMIYFDYLVMGLISFSAQGLSYMNSGLGCYNLFFFFACSCKLSSSNTSCSSEELWNGSLETFWNIKSLRGLSLFQIAD